MDIFNQLGEIIVNLYNSSGLASLDWQNYVMIGISFILMYKKNKKQASFISMLTRNKSEKDIFMQERT